MFTVIGAGPAGNYLAYLLAKKGEDVEVHEEHAKIGQPVQCTGILTDSVHSILKIEEEVVVNKISTFRIISPNKIILDINLKKKDLILDRAKFDAFIAEKAKESGVHYRLTSRFTGLQQTKDGIKIKVGNETETTDFLVGADGPFSSVAKSAGLFGEREYIAGVQARVSAISDPDIMEIFLDKGAFGWYVPEDENTGRIGICAYKDALRQFKALLMYKKAHIIQYQSGMIPVYNPHLKTQLENIALIGDAATQVKATTFGGIVPGLLAAQAYAKDPMQYDKNWRKIVGKDLWLNLQIRRIMNKFPSEEYDRLTSLFKKERVREVIETYDRDFPSKFLFKLLLREPRFLAYARYAL